MRNFFGTLLARLRADRHGSAMIETAAVAPVLALLSIGAFQVGAMMARQGELQSAAAEAEAIVLAKTPKTDSELSTIRNVLIASTGLSSGNVSVTYQFRCGTNSNLTTDQLTCGTGVRAWRYVHVILNTTYSPIWYQFGIGGDVPLRVDRTVLIG